MRDGCASDLLAVCLNNVFTRRNHLLFKFWGVQPLPLRVRQSLLRMAAKIEATKMTLQVGVLCIHCCLYFVKAVDKCFHRSRHWRKLIGIFVGSVLLIYTPISTIQREHIF